MYVFVDDGESVFWSHSKTKLKKKILKYYKKKDITSIRFDGESIIDDFVGYEVGFFHEIKKEIK